VCSDVALSRASNIETLTLRNLNPKCIRAHKKVVEFYRHLNTQQLSTSLAATTSSPSSSSSLSSSSSSSTTWKCPSVPLPNGAWLSRKPLIDFNTASSHNDEWMDAPTNKREAHSSNSSSFLHQRALVPSCNVSKCSTSTGDVSEVSCASNQNNHQLTSSVASGKKKKEHSYNSATPKHHSSSVSSRTNVLENSESPADIRTQNRARVLALMAEKGRKILY
jgi:hypothetical protein